MNLLITGAWNHSDDQLNKIRSMGHHVVLMQQEKGDLPCPAEEIEGVICNGLFLYHDIGLFRALRYIQLTSAGFDRVPLHYVESHGIELHNARGVYSIPMAEFAVGGVLQIYKQSRFFYENQKNGKWEKHRGLLELNGKTVLIVGCGSVGTECAKRFGAFGCNVIGVDVVSVDSPAFNQTCSIEGIAELLPAADVVLLSVPLTKETEGLFDARLFAQMKDGAVFVNLARGRLVDVDALLGNLGRLGGAVLDVFPEEPLDPASPLWDEEKVILTPHVSFVGDNNAKRLSKLIFRNLETKNEND